MEKVTVIGAGLAGSEAAWQLAEMGVPVKLAEMRPAIGTPAHHTGYCAELRNSEDLAKGVLDILRMDKVTYSKLRLHCREFSEKNCSREASGKLFLSAIIDKK